MNSSILYNKKTEIKEMLAKGHNYRAIAIFYGCSYDTARNFVYRNKLKLNLPARPKPMAMPPAPVPKPSITEAVQFDYQAMEDARVVITSLQKLGTNADRVRILGSEFVTNLIRNGQLFCRIEYSTGEWIWYLKQDEKLEIINDKDYLIKFSNGKIMVMCEDYFKRNVANSVAV